MKLNDEYKRNLIRHELGHWLVAQKLGFVTGDIKIKIIADSNGNYLHEGSSHIELSPSLIDKDDICRYLLNRVSVLYGGTAFQCITDGRDKDKILETDGYSDSGKITELIFLWRGIKFSHDTSKDNELKQRNELIKEAWNKAMKIHDDNKEMIDSAVEVISKKIMDSDETYTITRQELLEILIDHKSV